MICLNNLYVLFERPQNHCGLRCRDRVEMWEKVFFLFYSIKGHLTKYHYSSLCKSFAQRNSSILISWLDKAFVYAKTFNYIPGTQTTSLFLYFLTMVVTACTSLVQAQTLPNTSMGGKVDMEAHSSFGSYWQLIATGRRRVSFIWECRLWWAIQY